MSPEIERFLRKLKSVLERDNGKERSDREWKEGLPVDGEPGGMFG